MQKIVLLCDYGLDDACATLFVLDKRGDTPVDIVAIAGNSTALTSFNNATKLLSNYEGSLEGVRLIETTSVKQNYCTLPSIHGKDGMGDFLEKKTLNIPTLDYNEWITQSESVNLVSLGPCTITKAVLQNKRVLDLLIMAGNVAEKPNFNGYEFNHYLDRQAFSDCIAAFPEARVATLDSCRTPHFNFIKKSFTGASLQDKALSTCRALAEARHPDSCYVYDYIAVQYLFTPERFTFDKVTDPDGNSFLQLRYIEEDCEYV